ncbi:Oxysterol-binding protein [Trichuris trichiura]|uniref:Oxysterol-binding protein n=1 Tax=Trichuris trichiura TaxID=36087 RepID=A0A077ZL68_TRITR|nr:Oxysterol-binding protein [Trichuris trichiura]
MNASVICEERTDGDSFLCGLLALTSMDKIDEVSSNSRMTENQTLQSATSAGVKYFRHVGSDRPAVIINNSKSAAERRNFETGNKATLRRLRPGTDSANFSESKAKADNFLSTPTQLQKIRCTGRTPDTSTRGNHGARATIGTSKSTECARNPISKHANPQSKVRIPCAPLGKLRCKDSQNIAANRCSLKVELNGGQTFPNQQDDHPVAHALISQNSKTVNFVSRIPRHVYFLKLNAQGFYNR